MKYLTLAAVFVFIFTPDLAAAAFVQCEGTDVGGVGSACSLCDLVSMGNEILKWLIGVMMVIFSIIMVMAGFGLVTSGGNPSAKTAAKEKITNTLIGLIIVLAAWLLVDTIMKTLLPGNSGNIAGFGPWSTVKCQSQTPSVAGTPGSVFQPSYKKFNYQVFVKGESGLCKKPVSGGFDKVELCETAVGAVVGEKYIVKSCDGSAPATPPSWESLPLCSAFATCSQCQDLPASIITKGGPTCQGKSSPTGNCQLQGSLIAKVQTFQTLVNNAGISGARVTEAWPPTGWSKDKPNGIHSSACHGLGSCFDYGSGSTMSADNVNKILKAARDAGLNPKYEYLNSVERDSLIKGGVNPSDLSVQSSAPHFHISL